MSSYRVPEADRARTSHPALPGVADFFADAGKHTRSGDVPLLAEWSQWAARHESLDEVWQSARTPELMVFMLGHAVRRKYLDRQDAVHDALDRFVSWCVSYAGLDASTVAPTRPLAQSSIEWFALSGSSGFSRARRAAIMAERALAGVGDDRSPHEVRRQRTVQAAILRLIIDSPFFRAGETPTATEVDDGDITAAMRDLEREPAEPGAAETDVGDEDVYGTEIVLAPAQRGPWGLVTRLVGPPDPAGATPSEADALRRADGSLRHGMILLTKRPGEDYVPAAEQCFRDALSMLLSGVCEVHPKMAYACDRIGMVCQIQGKDEEAEEMYLRAIAIRDAGAWSPTLWDEVTLINLATLYADQGKHVLQDAMLERLQKLRRADERSGETT